MKKDLLCTDCEKTFYVAKAKWINTRNIECDYQAIAPIAEMFAGKRK